MARKPKDFKAFEFPGVDKAKFEAWKNAEMAVNKYAIVILVLIVIVNLFLIPIAGKFMAGPGFILILPLLILILRAHLKKKQAGITSDMIKKAKSRP